MSRTPHTETEAVNADSFLDIVASVVSIMIIMVLMVGLRIKHTPVDVPLSVSGKPVQSELQSEQASARSLEKEVLQTAQEKQRLQLETLARRQERDFLAVGVAALEQKIQTGRRRLGTESQQDFDLRRNLAEAKARLGEVRDRRIAAEVAPAAPVVVESYPTPISRPVDGRELHFQLQGNRVIFIPLDPLLERLKTDGRRQAYKLMDQPELTDTVGPEAGFRLRYTLERVDMTPESARESGRTGSYVRLAQWTLIPSSSNQGEAVEDALAENSEFRQVLARHRAGRTTVTLWTYPDSFEAFRKIRKELYRLGYPIAARPLPAGAPISGSPEGTKSASE